MSLNKYNPIDRLANFVQQKCASGMHKINDGLSRDQISIIEDKVKSVMQTSGLSEKGIEIVQLSGREVVSNGKNMVKLDGDGLKQVKDIVAKNLDAAKKGFMSNQRKLANIEKGTVDALCNIAKGNNAAYFHSAKKVVIPKNKLALTAFHEMGHAHNFNIGKVSKMLTKLKPATMLLPVIALMSLSTSKSNFRNTDDKDDRPFINKHAGKLAFLTFVPTLLEEGLASIKGSGMAKKVLSPDLLKKVNKTHALGFATYLIGALATSLTFSAVANITAKGDKHAAQKGKVVNFAAPGSGKQFGLFGAG